MEKDYIEQHNETYLINLNEAKKLCDKSTLGSMQKTYIKSVLSWAIEKHKETSQVCVYGIISQSSDDISIHSIYESKLKRDKVLKELRKIETNGYLVYEFSAKVNK